MRRVLGSRAIAPTLVAEGVPRELLMVEEEHEMVMAVGELHRRVKLGRCWTCPWREERLAWLDFDQNHCSSTGQDWKVWRGSRVVVAQCLEVVVDSTAEQAEEVQMERLERKEEERALKVLQMRTMCQIVIRVPMTFAVLAAVVVLSCPGTMPSCEAADLN